MDSKKYDAGYGDIIPEAARMLEVDEGVEQSPYKDTLGYWTIGVGHLLGKDIYKMKLSKRVINELLLEDMEEAWEAVCSIFGEQEVSKWTKGRRLALLNLAFNLGAVKLAMFKNTIAAIKAGRWEEAAKHLANSKWAGQVKGRSKRVIYMVESGECHESYSLRA